MTKANRILLKARRHIVGDRIGNNGSMFRGEGYDFTELREYTSGDDVRHINWNVTAKMGKPYVKVFRQEREINVICGVMLGGNLSFGDKLETLGLVVSIIGYSAVANGDPFGCCRFIDRSCDFTLPSKKNFVVANTLQSILETPIIGKKTDLSYAMNELYKRIKRRSLIVLVGDFFELPQLKLLAKKHEVVAIVVRDIGEEKPTLQGYNALIDPESGAHIEGDFGQGTLQKYTQNLQKHDAQLFEIFRTSGVRATKLYTHNNPAVVLRRLFEERA
jgi:uncharacterized protein (DUF58 family)